MLLNLEPCDTLITFMPKEVASERSYRAIVFFFTKS